MAKTLAQQYGIKPMKRIPPPTKKRLPRMESVGMALFIIPQRGVAIWDTPPDGYEFRGYASIRTGDGATTYPVYAHRSILDTAKIESDLAGFFLYVYEMTLED